MYAVVVIASLLGGAIAQNNINQPSGDTNTEHGMAKRLAPIGHRQPKIRICWLMFCDMNRDQHPGEREYDKKLTICRGC